MAAGNERERKTRRGRREKKQLSGGIGMRWRHLTGRESCSLRLKLPASATHQLPHPSLIPPPHAMASLGRLAAAACAGTLHANVLVPVFVHVHGTLVEGRAIDAKLICVCLSFD